MINTDFLNFWPLSLYNILQQKAILHLTFIICVVYWPVNILQIVIIINQK